VSIAATRRCSRTCGQRFIGEAVHAHDEDARERRPFVRDRQIQRGKAEIASELRAVHDVTADDIRAPERDLRRVEIARDERRPHRRRRYARAVRMRDCCHLLDFEAVFLAGGFQRLEIARAFRAIAKDVDNARAYFGLPPASNAGSRATGFAISATDRIR
jgi:hypothetical protein